MRSGYRITCASTTGSTCVCREDVRSHMTGPARASITMAMLGLLLAIPLPQLAAASSTSTISLSPPIGPPMTRVTVSGAGFGASETVDLRFDTRAVGSAVTDVSGAFNARIKVPRSALPGSHLVKAKGETSGMLAMATFTVRTDWLQFHFDAAHSGLNPYENVLDTSNVTRLVQAWA